MITKTLKLLQSVWANKIGILLSLYICCILVSGCYQHFYTTQTKTTTDADMLKKLQDANKYFILHLPDRNVALTNLVINSDGIIADEAILPKEHVQELRPDSGRANVVLDDVKKDVLMEVHLYTAVPHVKNGKISLKLSDINRIDVYELDAARTKTSRIISTIGTVVLILAVVGILAVAIACNCPQVYILNDANADFNGGLYSGAVYSTLERTDFMPLPAPVSDFKTEIRIANAKDEEQFINQVKLLAVPNTSDGHVLVDRHGNIFTYNDLKAPVTSIAAGLDQRNVFDKKDAASYNFAAENSNAAEIIVTFKRNRQSNKARLIVNGRNSAWSGYIFREFNMLFGESSEQWRKQQEKANPATLLQWQKDQSLPLMVYIKEGTQWKFVDYFALVGNTASRDMIMEIDLPASKGDNIELKIETAYRFWDLDFVALDQSENARLTGTFIEPSYAQTLQGSDEAANLLAQDKAYTHLTGTDAVNLSFNLPARAKEYSYFLVSNGYYHNLQKYSGKADGAALVKFRNKGRFSSFSKEKYQLINEALAKARVN